MLVLIVYVRLHLLVVGSTDRERSISSLPRELLRNDISPIDPMRLFSLEELNNIIDPLVAQ